MTNLFVSLMVIFFLSNKLSACEIHLQRYLVLLNKKAVSDDIFKNCNSTIKDFTASLFYSNSDVSHEFLRAALETENLEASVISNSVKTSVYDLDKSIKSAIEKDSLRVEKIVIPSGLPTSLNSIPELSCENCQKFGQSTYKLSMPGRIYFGEVHVGTSISAYISKVNLVQGEALTEQSLEMIQFITSKPELYVSDPEKIKFVKITQNIPANSPIMKSNLYPENIISPFKNITLMIESEGLIIRGSGYSQNSGAYGDSISVKVGNNDKIVNAKVIGKDLARIQL
jgi:flagella basal body P-ring formation protein FlgA